jgi:hypothetical protein
MTLTGHVNEQMTGLCHKALGEPCYVRTWCGLGSGGKCARSDHRAGQCGCVSHNSLPVAASSTHAEEKALNQPSLSATGVRWAKYEEHAQVM